MPATPANPSDDGPPALLERAGELADLARDLEEVQKTGSGRLVVIGGEAGVGKTSLLRALAAKAGGVRVLRGACDPLFTPRPLGPLRDVAEQAAGELQAVVAADEKPYEVAAALLRELARRPSLLVLEDLHWADEASLDVVRILARRVESVPVLVLLTYRDDELPADHPFRTVLGDIGREQTARQLRLGRLSGDAVATLAAPHEIDPEQLHRITGGNPFFVTEVLAAGGDAEIPPTVKAAVLGRFRQLPPAARSLVETVSIGSQPTELWLLEVLAPEDMSALDECLASGVLTADGDLLAFRHELARLAVEDSLSPDRRRGLHRAALAALEASPVGGQDLARLAHHAAAAGDAGAVQRFAPAAAEAAAAVGSHREAAAHYEQAIRYLNEVPAGERAQLLDRAADEYTLTGRMTESVEIRRWAVEAHRAAGDTLREGDSLGALNQPLMTIGRREEAEAAAREAVAVLEQCEPSGELAQAYNALAMLRYADSDRPGTVEWGERALALAEQVGDEQAVMEALKNVGGVEFLHGEDEGRRKLERCLEMARGAGLVGEMGWAYLGLAVAAVRHRSHSAAREYLQAGIEHCSRYDIEGLRPYLVALRAEQQLAEGRWEEAGDSAAEVLRARGVGPATVMALASLGRLRARRGDPGVWELLDRALTLCESSRELGRTGPVAIARAEAAWLEGRDAEAIEESELAWEPAISVEERWIAGELAQWRRRAGAVDEPPDWVARPFGLALAGDWQRAGEAWTELGCPYDAALARTEGDDAIAVRAIESLHDLGAGVTAAAVTRRLRERGVRGLPRGPRSATSANPAQLTARELEVLECLAEGMRNAEIAERLVISPRTVEHHVSAVLRKLDLESRSQAAAAAVRLGIGSEERGAQTPT
jgi:DNA-binding NarL/FixJ family response regulator/tetratricopeptide (TPR) repeat protein